MPLDPRSISYAGQRRRALKGSLSDAASDSLVHNAAQCLPIAAIHLVKSIPPPPSKAETAAVVLATLPNG